MTKNRTPTPVYLDPGMHPGLEVKGLIAVHVCNRREMVTISLACTTFDDQHNAVSTVFAAAPSLSK